MLKGRLAADASTCWPQTTRSLYRLFDQIIYYTVAHRKEREEGEMKQQHKESSRVESVPHGDFFLLAFFIQQPFQFRFFLSFLPREFRKTRFFLLSFLFFSGYFLLPAMIHIRLDPENHHRMCSFQPAITSRPIYSCPQQMGERS